MTSLAELFERREHELRLTPDRALETLDEAEEFLHDRGLLTRSADSALPSLYEACHEDPYKPGSSGFGQWPATKWPWFGELADRKGVYALKVHRGKNVLVTEEVAGLLDPILRAEIERMRSEADDWALLLDHLAATGPSQIDDLQEELGLGPKSLKTSGLPSSAAVPSSAARTPSPRPAEPTSTRASSPGGIRSIRSRPAARSI